MNWRRTAHAIYGTAHAHIWKVNSTRHECNWQERRLRMAMYLIRVAMYLIRVAMCLLRVAMYLIRMALHRPRGHAEQDRQGIAK